MCGICGILFKKREAHGKVSSLSNLNDMIISQTHRGPDYGGFFLETWQSKRFHGSIEKIKEIRENDHEIVMGHRRLSIVDLSERANQPMSNEDETVWMVFNGEIYNHNELKSHVLKEAHLFRSASDGEVIIHLYEEKGEEVFSCLNGIFAIALWDSRRSKLLLARDRFGVKPLYYYQSSEKIVFASEIKAFLYVPGLILSENRDRVAELITFRYIAGEETCFKQIAEINPGHYHIFSVGESIKVKYWSFDSNRYLLKRLPLNCLQRELIERMHGAVKRQLMADVPIGSLVSGGIDSSLLTSIAKMFYGAQLSVFSVGFYEPEFDETPYGNLLASHLKINLQTLYIGPEEYADSLLRAIWHLDEPIAHHNSVQFYLLLKYAREEFGIKVMFSGEGADELFGGYDWYNYLSRERAWWKNMVLFFAWKAFPQSVLRRYKTDIMMAHHVFNPSLLHESLQSTQDIFGDREKIFFDIRATDLIAHHLLYDQNVYLPSILQRMDRMGMASGVEVRVPYLDNELVDFIYKIPASLKIHENTKKLILRKISQKYIPDEIIARKKMGFPIPLNEWFRNRDGLGRYIGILFEDKTYERGYFNTNIKKLVQKHLANEGNYGYLLWNVLNFELWYRIFIERSLQP